MNSARKGRVIAIDGAGDDARVGGRSPVLGVEMTPVQRKDRTAFACGVPDHLFIRHTLVCLSGVTGREHVVPESTEFLDDRLWEVLV